VSWREVALALASLAAAVAVADRLLCLAYPAFEIDGSLLVHDAELGWKLRPSHVIPERGQRINRTGFRGGEFTRRGDPELVAFLGDSVTFGATRDESTFPHLFEELSGRPAYNFGVPRYGPLEYQRILPIVERFEPGQVVLGFFVGNDVLDCRPGRRPHFEDRPGRRSPWGWSGIHRLLVFRGLVSWEPLEEALREVRESAWNERQPVRGEDEFTAMELSRVEVFREGAHPERWACVEQALRAISAQRPDLVVLVLPDEMQVDDELWAELMSKAADPGGFDRTLPNRRVAELAAAAALRVLDATPALRAAGERVFFRWDSHPNPVGNRVIAELLARELAPSGAARAGAASRARAGVPPATPVGTGNPW
jgi:hypothetical protein